MSAGPGWTPGMAWSFPVGGPARSLRPLDSGGANPCLSPSGTSPGSMNSIRFNGLMEKYGHFAGNRGPRRWPNPGSGRGKSAPETPICRCGPADHPGSTTANRQFRSGRQKNLRVAVRNFWVGHPFGLYMWCRKPRFCWFFCVCGIHPQGGEKKRHFLPFCL